MTQRDLSARLGTSEAAVSRMVAGLARDGYVDVARGPGNRRSLSLTAEGGAALTAAGAALGDGFDRLVRGVGHRPRRARGLRAHRLHSTGPPRRSDMHPWTPLIITHVFAALTSVVLGGYQLWRRPRATPGTVSSAAPGSCSSSGPPSRRSGSAHINEGAFSWLHVLSVVTLVTVTLGVVNAVRGNVPAHRGNMVGSWLGASARWSRPSRSPAG